MSYAAKLERNVVRIVNTATGSTVRTLSGDFTGPSDTSQARYESNAGILLRRLLTRVIRRERTLVS